MDRTTTILTLMCLLATLATALSKAPENTPPDGISALVSGNNAFAVKLYGQLRDDEGNLFFSPFSVSSALGMTFSGARGNTADEMRSALELPDGEGVHSAFGELISNLVGTEPRLDIANALSLTGGDVSGEFKSLLAQNYHAEIFFGDLDKINEWVSDKTHGKIEKILDRLDPNSVCVILNAIYFKGDWLSPFQGHATRDAPFYIAPDDEVSVPMMFQESRFKLLEGDGFQAISLPYKGRPMSMVIFLPNERGDLAGIESKLTPQNLAKWLSEIDSHEEEKVKLYIPKFELKTDYSLVPPFKSLGMRDAFMMDVADFSGTGWPVGELWISQIKHKAFIEVNEKGTEAAAATAVEMATKAAMPQPTPIFRADHPFIFIIRDNETGSILFMGRISNPKADK